MARGQVVAFRVQPADIDPSAPPQQQAFAKALQGAERRAHFQQTKINAARTRKLDTRTAQHPTRELETPKVARLDDRLELDSVREKGQLPERRADAHAHERVTGRRLLH